MKAYMPTMKWCGQFDSFNMKGLSMKEPVPWDGYFGFNLGDRRSFDQFADLHPGIKGYYLWATEMMLPDNCAY